MEEYSIQNSTRPCT